MPLLPITDGKGQLHPLAHAIVFARMCHPRSEENYGYALSWYYVAHCLSTGNEIVPRWVLENLLVGPSAQETDALGSASLGGAFAAGEILQVTLSCKAQHPEFPASVSKSWDVLSQYHKNRNRVGTSAERVSSSVQFYRREWTRFKPVAHLWAANAMLMAPGTNPYEASHPQGRHDKFLALLSAGEAVRKLSETTFAPGQARRNNPVLNPNETWRCPDDLNLPESTVTMAPLPKEILDLLAVRRAPVARSS